MKAVSLSLLPKRRDARVWIAIRKKCGCLGGPSRHGTRVPSSSGTENSAKAFSFLNGRSDFLTLAVVPALLATPSAALGDLASSASVAARPTHGDDVLEDHGGSILCPRVGHSATS